MGLAPLYILKIAAGIWPFLTIFGGDVTLRLEHRIQMVAESNTNVTLK